MSDVFRRMRARPAQAVEVLRKLYYEVARGRTRVRVVPSTPVVLDAPPIFLCGVERSGTTLLRYIVDSHSRICCPPETDFVAALRPLVDDYHCRSGLEGLGFDQQAVTTELRAFVAHFFGNYAAARGKPRWADKTPRYSPHYDFIAALFPEARFVVIHRHGLDVAHSSTRNGTVERHPEFRVGDEDLRVAATRHWDAGVRELIAFTDANPERCHVIGYEALCAEPERVCREIFAFVGEPWEPGVLRFWEHDHDVGKESGRIIGTRGFDVARDHYLAWPDDVRAAAMDVAGASLTRLGYPRGP